MTKNIKINEYWYVHYKHKTRGYEGPVLVKDIYPDEPGYSCVIVNDLEKKYVNYLSGHRFIEKDFKAKSNEKEFLMCRIKYLRSQIKKAEDQLKKT